jgi:hypothetical protein
MEIVGKQMPPCGSVLLVPDGPGNPQIECRCLLSHVDGESMHQGIANGVQRRWKTSQARRRRS